MMPDVSIIICTRDRSSSLRETLLSLAGTSTPPGMVIELIIVDNNSNDQTAEVIAECRQALDAFNIRYLFNEIGGKSSSLNRGLDASSGRAILCTDDDVRFPNDWIHKMSAGILSGHADGVAGGVRLAQHLIRDWMMPLHRGWLAETTGLIPRLGQWVGANLAFGRHVLCKVPQFDERLGPGPGGLGTHEETVFAEEMLRAGFCIADCLDCEVEHHFDVDRLTRESFLAAARRHGASSAYRMITYGEHNFAVCKLRHLKHRIRTLQFRVAHRSHEEMPSQEELVLATFDAFWNQYFREIKSRSLIPLNMMRRK